MAKPLDLSTPTPHKRFEASTESENESNVSLLSEKARGLYVVFLSSISRDELKTLEVVFEEDCKAGILDEPYFKRTEGASFNPLPARLAHIAIKELRETGFEFFYSAFMLPRLLLGNDPQPAADAPAFTVAQRLRNPGSQESLSETEERLYLVFLLDLARHLHQIVRPLEFLSAPHEIIGVPLYPRYSGHHRIADLISSAWKRYQRHRRDKRSEYDSEVY